MLAPGTLHRLPEPIATVRQSMLHGICARHLAGWSRWRSASHTMQRFWVPKGRSAQLMSSSCAAPKAAILVIGDELLKGSISDVNTPWLAKLLYSRGVDLMRAEFIPDDSEDIKVSVLKLRERVGPEGFVFTSGGIGPTHDDVTYASIASAFGLDLALHQPTVEQMRKSYAKRGVELNDARLRMATLPTPSEVLFTPNIWVPLVHIQGVYILPGIPKLFQAMITAHQERFSGTAYESKTLYTHLGEGDIAVPLTAVAAKYPNVSIGSYPNVTEDGSFKVKLQFTSRDSAALQAAVEAVRQDLVDVFEELKQ